ncbi:MAG: glycosyltransferase family 2 protein [Niastella sp.]|nr:glycosyltransferase family 2 protein [Niastella sp.]
MSKVSAYIIGYNEERKIEAAIRSVIDWADEVIVADSFSTDKTAELSEKLGARVVQIPFEGFGKLRNVAIRSCQYPWVFSLDADERCTPEARDEILKIVKANRADGPVAYWVPRRNFFMGQWVKYSGWYPDYRQPQLFKNGTMRYTEVAVHEEFEADGEIGKLTNPIWQFPFENLTQILNKANRYSTLGAEKLQHKKKGNTWKAFTHGFAIFFQTYFFRLGFLDGRAGFTIAVYNFISTYFKYAKLAELQQGWKEPVTD